jgi:hypothetical protein
MQAVSIAEGVIRRIHNKLPYVAAVTVQVEHHVPHSEIHARCTGLGWGGSQGTLDDVSARGYEDWKAAAIYGAQYALWIAAARPCRITITRIVGRDGTDTNPTIVGAAAAYAVWKALTYQPSREISEWIEAIVFRSWQTPDALPNFDKDVST